MQALPALFAGMGGGSAALGVVGIGLTLAGTAANVAAAKADHAAEVSQYQYQQQVAARNAQIAEENAAKAIAAANAEAQETDYDARLEIGALMSQASASGLRMDVGSNYLRRRSLESLARKDRGFRTAQGSADAANERSRRDDYIAEYKQYDNAIYHSGVKKKIGITKSLISGASTVAGNAAKALGGA